MEAIKYRVIIDGQAYYWGIFPEGDGLVFTTGIPRDKYPNRPILQEVLANSRRLIGIDAKGREIYEGDEHDPHLPGVSLGRPGAGRPYHFVLPGGPKEDGWFVRALERARKFVWRGHRAISDQRLVRAIGRKLRRRNGVGHISHSQASL